MKNPKKNTQENVIREQPMSYDDYAQLPDDGLRFELADGVLEAMSPSPNAIHQIVMLQIANQLIRDIISTFCKTGQTNEA